MTVTADSHVGRGSERWGRAVVAVSVAGGVLTVIAVLLLGMAVYGFMSEFGGSPPPWWYWPSVLGFAASGVLGLVLTSAIPWLAYLLRLIGWVPLLSVGASSPWLLAVVLLPGVAHVSLLLTTWGWTRSVAGRWVVAAGVSVMLALLTVPVDRELSCETPGDPPETCDAWYRTTAGWGLFEEDDRQLVGWVLVVLLGGVLVAIPVPPRE